MNSSAGPALEQAALYSATDLRHRMAQHEAEKVAAEAQLIEEKAAKLKAVMDEFQKPPERSKEQVLALVMQLVARAAERGESEAEVYRFPSIVCSDQGRALNNSRPDWTETLTGRPQMAYEFWRETLKPLGFGLKAQVLDYPGGMPGDVGLSLTW